MQELIETDLLLLGAATLYTIFVMAHASIQFLMAKLPTLRSPLVHYSTT